MARVAAEVGRDCIDRDLKLSKKSGSTGDVPGFKPASLVARRTRPGGPGSSVIAEIELGDAIGADVGVFATADDGDADGFAAPLAERCCDVDGGGAIVL